MVLVQSMNSDSETKVGIIGISQDYDAVEMDFKLTFACCSLFQVQGTV